MSGPDVGGWAWISIAFLIRANSTRDQIEDLALDVLEARDVDEHRAGALVAARQADR